MRVLDGKAIAGRMAGEIAREIAGLHAKPVLAILSFSTPASDVYRKAQR